MATQLTQKQKEDLQPSIDALSASITAFQKAHGLDTLSKPTPATVTNSTNYSDSSTDFTNSEAAKYGSRGEGFAPAFESTLKENNINQDNVDLYGGITGVLDYNAGQSNGPGGNSEKAKKDAEARAKKLQQQQQISGNTTYAFNPETMSKTSRAVDKFGFALDETTNTPFEPKKYKEDAKNNLIDITSKELGKLFTSPDEIYSAYETNPQFKATLDKFISKGGSIEGIAKNVTVPASAVNIVNDVDNGDGTHTIKYSDGTTGKVSVTKNADGTESYTDVGTGKTQSPADYLASLRNPQANQVAQDKAIADLVPETDVAQKEIMRVARISKELQTLYFGDEKTVGIYQMKKAQAEQEQINLQERERDDKATAKEKSEFAIEKNNAEVRLKEAEIEENRLAAKNYMTQKLAQLGALQTTGAAVLALQTLETKYQMQVSNLRTKATFANRELEINLREKINDIENNTNDKVLKIQEDLTKDSETMAKEVMKEQQAADKEIYSITNNIATKLRERTTKYTEDLKKEAEKYAKDFAANASGNMDFTAGGALKSKSKLLSETEKKLEASRAKGGDFAVNDKVYLDAYNNWIDKGGTAKSFVLAFPPATHVSPDNTTLPPFLRYKKESPTLKDNPNDIAAQIEAAFPSTNN